jgi:murein tripeptide amidase MpaA
MPYLNVAEIESWCELAELKNPDLCTHITLPHKTFEGRTCHALRIRAGDRRNRHGVLLLGGQHAREWGSSDILVDLTDRILSAYTGETSLAFGGRTYSAKEVKELAENVELFVLPCLNPDGRAYSQTVAPLWRKNRRPIPGSNAIGCDLNRNYDFLWDFRSAFDPAMLDGTSAPQLVVSDDPETDLFQGTEPFSEAETKNLLRLLDDHPQIRFLVDLHCYREIIAYPWGDDANQSTDPEQSFANIVHDGIRGTSSQDYGEYMRAADQSRMHQLAIRMQTALKSVRGKQYAIGQKYFSLYPTCGTSTCYAFSRHLTAHSSTKIDSFLFEWGVTFQPPYEREMRPIFEDVGAALTELGLSANRVPLLEVEPRVVKFPFPKDDAKKKKSNGTKTRQVKVTNRGTRPVAISVVAIEPSADSADFQVGNVSLRSIGPGEKSEIEVIYSAGSARPRGMLLVETHEVGQSLKEVTAVELTRAPRLAPREPAVKRPPKPSQVKRPPKKKLPRQKPAPAKVQNKKRR